MQACSASSKQTPLAKNMAYQRIKRSLLSVTLGMGLLGACQSGLQTTESKVKALPMLVADHSPAGQETGAVRIEHADQLITGPAATGATGDYLLYNDKIQVVVSSITHTGGVAATGGNIIDVGRAGGKHDALGEVFTYLDNTFPRHLNYELMFITGTGGSGGDGQVSVIGRDNMNPEIHGVTHYSLSPGSTQVKIRTELTNTSDQMIREYELGDALQWGRTEHFAPGYGSELAGLETQGPWIAAVGPDISYGWTAMGVTLRGPNGNGWSDLIVAKIDLPPGGTAIYERYLTVGTGDVASLLPAIFDIRGEISEQVAGAVIETGSDYRVSGAQVDAYFARSGRPYATAITDAQGVFSMTLPPDEYRLEVKHKSRKSLGTKTVDLMRGMPAPQTLEMSAPGRLRFSITGSEGQGIPAKISLRGLMNTPTPNLGPKYETDGALNYVFSLSGQGEVEIPPGRYEITASRGIEYGISQQEVDIEVGETLLFEATLNREVDTTGYVGADLHQSSHLSPDCAVTPENVLIANLAEGVEVIIGADDNTITSYDAALEALGNPSDIKVIPGVVMTSPGLGSITAFPMAHHPTASNGGAPLELLMKPTELMSTLAGPDTIVQVNHPREGGGTGYFDLYGLDPNTGFMSNPNIQLGFNTLEVFNGKRLRSASTVLRDWFLLLNQGYSFTAVGNSDSHTTVSQERGYPRTFIKVGEDNPELVEDQSVVRALKLDRAAIVTNGPFIEAQINGQAQTGELLTVDGGAVELSLKVQAPQWIQIDKVEIIANGEVIRTLTAASPNGIIKLDTTEQFVVPRDTWFVIVARGSKGMDPVVPKYKGTTITPLGFTNPIWVDVDGDGQFTAPYPAGEQTYGYKSIPLKKAGSQ